MTADLLAAILPAGVLLMATLFAFRLGSSRTVDPKFRFLNSLLKALEDEKDASRHKTAA